MINIKELFTTSSNLLSLFRLLLAIPFWFLMDYLGVYEYRLIIFGMCILAMITDVLDGYLARKFNHITDMGKIIDPLADKVLIAVIILKLYLANEIPEYYFWMIILRDVIIFTGGVIISNKIGRVLPSNMLGKITVTSIGFFILIILLQVDKTNLIYLGIYYLSIVLIISSLIGYAIRSTEFLKQKENESIQKP